MALLSALACHFDNDTLTPVQSTVVTFTGSGSSRPARYYDPSLNDVNAPVATRRDERDLKSGTLGRMELYDIAIVEALHLLQRDRTFNCCPRDPAV